MCNCNKLLFELFEDLCIWKWEISYLFVIIWCKFYILYDLVIKVTDSCEITIAYKVPSVDRHKLLLLF